LAIDREYLRQHYASLSDEALAAVERDDLVEAAQKVYDEERARRGVAVRQKPAAPPAPRPEPAASVPIAEDEEGEPPAWIEGAECACEFFSSGRASSDRAQIAYDALQAGGIPCHINIEEVPPEPPPRGTQYSYRLMVPAGVILKAQGILDKEIFGPETEDSLKAHLEALSDEALRELTPEVICVGLADRIERLTRLYREEVARRESESDRD
jgi:hypothetical protein